nr:aminotransferase class V-fold PLP-dependent enzyme [Kibdelosporangium sp. MJ126-NF4]CEL19746.1 Cysteine desulfurase [Kibdelosporangium sp. MJ126-NF4]CTQ96971.1 Cysteine desulfurase (EC 2.8.1.7) [Kibdelosporangium sp. MJ126-NF4]
MDRRQFVLGTGIAAGGILVGPAQASAADEWDAVRRQFPLDPDLINFAHFFLTTHPRPVQAEIERLRRWLEPNTHVITYDSLRRLQQETAEALAGYIGGRPDDIALTQNTTTGMTLAYATLKIKPGQELLVNDQDHTVHRVAAQRAAERAGGTYREVSLYAHSGKATVDEIAGKLRAAITSRTRVVGMTWVQSSTGVKMPIRVLADVVAEANRGRAEEDRCLLIVDGVHGFAAVDDDPAKLGADVFATGTHKWLFGPRGTGFLWVKPGMISHFTPIGQSFDSRSATSALSIGGFTAFEYQYAVPAAVKFHQRIGRPRVAQRVTTLSGQLRDGLAGMRNVVLWTPRDPALSAGMTCFDVNGHNGDQVVTHLRSQGIQITTAAYRIPYARISTSILNTPAEVETVLRRTAELAR